MTKPNDGIEIVFFKFFNRECLSNGAAFQGDPGFHIISEASFGCEAVVENN